MWVAPTEPIVVGPSDNQVLVQFSVSTDNGQTPDVPEAVTASDGRVCNRLVNTKTRK